MIEKKLLTEQKNENVNDSHKKHELKPVLIVSGSKRYVFQEEFNLNRHMIIFQVIIASVKKLTT
jgi:hypothetical protein